LDLLNKLLQQLRLEFERHEEKAEKERMVDEEIERKSSGRRMNKREKARGSQGQTESGNGKIRLASRDGNRKDLNDSGLV